MPKFSKKAKTHAALSRKRTQRMLREAALRSGDVTISYLPGFGSTESKTKFPFVATINGERVLVVSRGGKILFERSGD